MCAPRTLHIVAVAVNRNVTVGQDGGTHDHHHHNHYSGECLPHLGAVGEVQGAEQGAPGGTKLDRYKLPRSRGAARSYRAQVFFVKGSSTFRGNDFPNIRTSEKRRSDLNSGEEAVIKCFL